MNPHEVPCLRLFFPFAIGLGLGAWLETPIPALRGILTLFLLLGVWLSVRQFSYQYRWLFGLYLHFCLVVFAYDHYIRHNEGRQPLHFSAHLPQARAFVGTVYAAPAVGQKVKIPVRLHSLQIAGADTFLQASGHVMLLLEPGPQTDSIRYGDELAFRGEVTQVEGPKNPHAFDYRQYLHFQNIHYQVFIANDSCVRTGRREGWAIWRWAYAARAHLLQRLAAYFPEKAEYAVASALLVGYTEDLSDELRTAYAETGSMHALAVSGTHIGMLYVGLMFLVGRLRLRGRFGRLAETGLILLGIWAFTFVTGATASVLRASVMFSVYLLGKAFWREASAWNVLPASALMLLMYNPYLLFDVGFQLSYSAVAGMVFFYPRFYKLFPPMSRWLDEPLKVLLVGVSAQLGTLPLTLYYFHQFPVYFWLSGWVVVLVGAIFLWGGAVLIALDACSPTAADALGWLLFQMLHWMNKSIFWIQQLPGAVWRNIWIPLWLLPFVFLGLVFAGAALATRRGKWLMGLAAVLIICGLQQVIATWRHQRQTEVYVYCVKDGRLMDFFLGETAITLSDTLSEKQENFAANANRIAHGIREKVLLRPGPALHFSHPQLYLQGPYIQFLTQRLALLDPGHPQPKLPVEVAVLSKNLRPPPAPWPCQLLLLDATNKKGQLQRWQESGARLGFATYNIREIGAWHYQHHP